MCFRKKEKLNPMYIGPLQVLRSLGPVAYKLGSPPVPAHKFYKLNFQRVIVYLHIEIQPDLTYVEIHMHIVDREIKYWWNKEITTVKVIWRNHQVEEPSWELESEMKEIYHQPFNV